MKTQGRKWRSRLMSEFMLDLRRIARRKGAQCWWFGYRKRMK